MSELQPLLRQLRESDAQVRIKACEALGQAGDPAAIPELVRIYQQDDDPYVVKAAEKSLKRLGKMAPGGGSKLLQRVVMGLSASLVLLLVLNVLLRVMGGGSEDATATPQVQYPSNREVLIAQYQDLLAKTQADTAAMRAEWGLPTGQLTCQVTLNRPKQQALSVVDQTTYSDFGFVNFLNQAITNLNAFVISNWDAACQPNGARGTIEQANQSNAELTTIEGYLAQAQAGLTRAIEQPVLPSSVLPTATNPAAAPVEVIPTTEALPAAETPTPGA